MTDGVRIRRATEADLPILLELSLNSPEEILAHQPGDIDENPIFR